MDNDTAECAFVCRGLSGHIANPLYGLISCKAESFCVCDSIADVLFSDVKETRKSGFLFAVDCDKII